MKLQTKAKSEDMTCARCGEDVTFSFIADDGARLYEGPDGWLTCTDFIEHDDHGEYRPVHIVRGETK